MVLYWFVLVLYDIIEFFFEEFVLVYFFFIAGGLSYRVVVKNVICFLIGSKGEFSCVFFFFVNNIFLIVYCNVSIFSFYFFILLVFC